MRFRLDPEVAAFQEEVREFIAREINSDAVQGMMPQGESPAKKRFLKKLAERGWIGLDLPTRYGGAGRAPIYRLILQEELDYAHLPSMMPELGMAHTVLRYGSDPLKDEILPRVTAADLVVALALSEADAGSDLASLRLSAVRDGDVVILNGEKMWTSAAHFADVLFVACRTTPGLGKHEGISLLLADVNAPGIEIRPIHTMGGHRTNIVRFEDARVPIGRVIGAYDQGWRYLTESLDEERMAFALGGLERDLDEFLAWITEEGRWDDRAIRSLAVDLSVRVEAARTHLLQSLSALARGGQITIEATMLKITLTEAQQRIAEDVTELLGAPGLLSADAPGAPMKGRFEHAWRSHVVSTIGGGTNEALRDLLAVRRLGLPRARRPTTHEG